MLKNILCCGISSGSRTSVANRRRAVRLRASPASGKRTRGLAKVPETEIGIDQIMRIAPVIPVLVIDDAASARPITEALVAGGLRVLEVTLRTPAALDVLRKMADVEGAVVGVGTVLNERISSAALKREHNLSCRRG